MRQHPKIAVAWAVASLERALGELGSSKADARARRQFHQLLLALEGDGYVFLDARMFQPGKPPAKVLPMRPRTDLAG